MFLFVNYRTDMFRPKLSVIFRELISCFDVCSWIVFIHGLNTRHVKLGPIPLEERLHRYLNTEKVILSILIQANTASCEYVCTQNSLFPLKGIRWHCHVNIYIYPVNLNAYKFAGPKKFTAAILLNRGAEKIRFHFTNERSILLGHNNNPCMNSSWNLFPEDVRLWIIYQQLLTL